jgi:translation elongation factor EF-1beta
LEARGSQVEVALKKIDKAFGDFSSFYATLIEKGIEETEYDKVFADLTFAFKELYTTSKSNFDALRLNTSQFIDGRLERDAYERSLIRIEQYIIGAEFEIRLKILPHLKRVEKELLKTHIAEKLQEIGLPEKMKEEVKQEISTLQTDIANAEEAAAIDQVEEYVGIGKRILNLGNKVWKFAERAAPAALPFILRIFSSG